MPKLSIQTKAMSPFLAELIGTMILIVLGDGVVANVVLNKSKGQNSGWIVITTGWALGVAVAAFFLGLISGAHLHPPGPPWLGAVWKIFWGPLPAYIFFPVSSARFGATVWWVAPLF